VNFAQGAIGLSIAYEFAPQTANSPPVVKYRRTLSIDSHQISPADYLALKEAIRLASRSTSGEVILRKES